jgi:cytochrome c556
MKHIKRALRPLAEMIKAKTFDAAGAEQRGKEIADYLQQFKELFPTGSENADGKARRNIWTDRGGFETARSNAYAAALAVSKAANPDSFRTAYKTLGAACTACHDKFADLK